MRGGRAEMEDGAGVDFNDDFVDQFVLPPDHVAAVAAQAAHAVGEAPLARGALAGLGGAGNADRLDVGGVGGGCRGEGFEVSDVGVFEAVEVVDEVVVAAVEVAATDRDGNNLLGTPRGSGPRRRRGLCRRR